MWNKEEGVGTLLKIFSLCDSNLNDDGQNPQSSFHAKLYCKVICVVVPEIGLDLETRLKTTF